MESWLLDLWLLSSTIWMECSNNIVKATTLHQQYAIISARHRNYNPLFTIKQHLSCVEEAFHFLFLHKLVAFMCPLHRCWINSHCTLNNIWVGMMLYGTDISKFKSFQMLPSLYWSKYKVTHAVLLYSRFGGRYHNLLDSSCDLYSSRPRITASGCSAKSHKCHGLYLSCHKINGTPWNSWIAYKDLLL